MATHKIFRNVEFKVKVPATYVLAIRDKVAFRINSVKISSALIGIKILLGASYAGTKYIIPLNFFHCKY